MSSIAAVLYRSIIVSLVGHLLHHTGVAGLALIRVDQRGIVVAEDTELLRLEAGEVRSRDLTVDVSRL